MSVRLLILIVLSTFLFKTNAQNSKVNGNPFLFGEEELAKYGSLELSNEHTDKSIHHQYFRQVFQGKAVWGSVASLHEKEGHNLYKQTQQLIPFVFDFRIGNTEQNNAKQTISLLATKAELGKVSFENIQTLETQIAHWSLYESQAIAHEPIALEAVWFQKDKNTLHHAFAMLIDAKVKSDWILYIVDAEDGTILKEESLSVSCNHNTERSGKEECHGLCESEKLSSSALTFVDSFQYNVFPLPIESPYYGVRSLVQQPWDSVPSPFGWHRIDTIDYTVSKGNNVDTYLDVNASNSVSNGDDDRAQGGDSLHFDFPWLNNGMHTLHQDAALTNIFYMTNIIHDVLHYYGFDESSGNFQEDNYTAFGNPNDYVRAEVQDGGSSCNANFGTPIDGLRPRMQTFLCNSRDLAFDNAITAHEIGHGISNRLVGGRLNTSCLNNQEQMGEGWSDWLGYILTIESGDTGTDARGIGTWLLGQGQSGLGIRAKKYSTDFAVNNFTYNDIKTQSIPHGIGSVWATMLWDLTWGLIDEYGFDGDLYDASTGGNKKALELILQALKMTACKPGFVDGRDAIIAADSLLNGGANNRLIWETFARRGLGYSADQGSSNSRADGAEAFDLPPYLSIDLVKTVDKLDARRGEELTYTLSLSNNYDELLTGLEIVDPIPANTTFVSSEGGAILSGDTLYWTGIDLAIGQDTVVGFKVQVDQGTQTVQSDFYDDIENSDTLFETSFVGTTSWSLSSTDPNSGIQSWFAPNTVGVGIANLDFASGVGLTEESRLTFVHHYNTEFDWDGGLVFISLDNGISWVDLGDHFIMNGYNARINKAIPGFSGNSQGYITSVVDLSAYAGQFAQFRFQMNCDQFANEIGWYIDDITVDNLSVYIPNVAIASEGTLSAKARLMPPTRLIRPDAELIAFAEVQDIICHNENNGSIAISSPLEGTAPTYAWSTGASTEQIINLAAGIYKVTVSKGGSDYTLVRHISNPDTLTGSIAVIESGAGNGIATLSINGGTPDYSAIWSSGQTGLLADRLLPGTYEVTVTDQRGCQIVESATLNEPDCDSVLLEIVLDFDQFPQETKYLFLEGLDTIYDSGYFENEEPFSRLIINHCLDTSCYDFIVQDEYGDGLCGPNSAPGGYVLTDVYKDIVLVDGCFPGSGDTTGICINDLSISFACVPMSCDGTPDASITANAIGGSGSFAYTWDHGPIGASIFGLGAGTYIVTATNGSNSIIDSMVVEPVGFPLVTNRNDDGHGSLRRTVMEACEGDTIRFSPDLDSLPIFLTTGSIAIQKDLVIEGLGRNNTLISGTDTDNLFTISTGKNVSLMNLTLSNGKDDPEGGAIVNLGNLNLVNVDIQYSYSQSNKTPLINKGTLIISGNAEMRY